MASQNTDGLNFKKFLPTLLSDAELREELTKRSVKRKNLDKKPKDELLLIYMRHFMSLPQRDFPNNHHGKIINQMILKERLKSRKSSEETNSTHQFGFADDRGKSKIRQLSLGKKGNDSATCDRLKPPVSKSDVSGKKISLSRSGSSANSSFEKIIIKDRSKDKSKTNHSSAEQSEKTKVHLKRPISESEKTKDELSPLKKVRQRIAWP